MFLIDTLWQYWNFLMKITQFIATINHLFDAINWIFTTVRYNVPKNELKR